MTKTAWFQVRVDEKEKKRLIRAAKKEGMTLSGWIRFKIRPWLVGEKRGRR